MVTMMKEKVNTHFSFPLQLNMAPYSEEYLMGDKADQGNNNNNTSNKFLLNAAIKRLHNPKAWNKRECKATQVAASGIHKIQ